jgi:hypothetical protein
VEVLKCIEDKFDLKFEKDFAEQIAAGLTLGQMATWVGENGKRPQSGKHSGVTPGAA